MLKVKVPATTANVGPGFDSLGMAISLYNEIQVEEIQEGLEIEVDGINKDLIDLNENNLVYKSMMKTFEKIGKTPKGLRIKQYNEIPVSRGMGSSAASIVGGIVAANGLYGSPLSKEELLNLAVEIEGHPDNVAPALFGGLVVSNQEGDKTHYVKAPIHEDLNFLAGIPDFVLSTKESRNALPKTISFSDAVFNVGKSSLLVAALFSGELDKLKVALQDRLHQPYRMKLNPLLEKFFIKAEKSDVKNIFLSGAGPTVMMLTGNKDSDEEKAFKEIIDNISDKWTFKSLKGDNVGVRIFNNSTDE